MLSAWFNLGPKSKRPSLAEERRYTARELHKSHRGNWGGRFDALLSYIGYCVGLGNVWRFPYLCYENGGGAFLIPYVLMVIVAGLPIYVMELALGQYASLSAITIWKISPVFKGVGYCAVIGCMFFCVYYGMLLGYTLYYIVASMASELSWATCNNKWNTPACTIKAPDEIKSKFNSVPHTLLNTTVGLLSDLTDERNYQVAGTSKPYLNITRIPQVQRRSPAEEFWERHVLDKGSGLSDYGSIQLKLLIGLMVAWILTFICVVKGVKSTGKVVYFTATFPYVMLTILLIRGLTLPGAIDGVIFYLNPDFEKLKDVKVWGAAASQVFWSLGVGWGVLITYSSFQKFNYNAQSDAIITVVVCVFTSLFAGLAIFSVVGFIAHELKTPVSKVISSGPGLVFVVYPEALSRLPAAPVWAVFFFFTLLTISLDSLFATLETVNSAIADSFPDVFHVSKSSPKKALLALVSCFILFICGIPLSTQAGIYILTLMDWYVGYFLPIVVAFFEVTVVSYVYGFKRFSDDYELMMGYRPNFYYKITCMFLTPVSLLLVFISNAASYDAVHLDNYRYPPWGEALGWLLTVVTLACIPILAALVFCQKIGGSRNLRSTLARPWTGKTIKLLTQPEADWGPAGGRRACAKVGGEEHYKFEEDESNQTDEIL